MREVRFSDHPKLLLQLRVLGLGLLQDGDVGIGVFPESEKILIGGLRPRGVVIEGISAAKLKMRQCPKHIVRYDRTVINDVLKFGCRLLSIPCLQIGLSSHVYQRQTVWPKLIT